MTLLHVTGWTLVHFLWQGAILVAAFAVVDAVLRHSSAKLRYAVASTAMLLMFVCAAATFFVLTSLPDTQEPFARAQSAAAPYIASQPGMRIASGPHSVTLNYLQWFVYIWMAGVIGLSTRMAIQWVRLDRYRRRGIRLLDQTWQERIGRIAGRLRLKRTVRAYESALADVPSVIGWLRPVVLVPASAMLQLSPGMIEALLAHELAHVRRHDYLINLLQSFVEILFFYHPGVWWVGRRMREERENCCDDLAVAVCGDPVIYARALADLEQSRSAMPELAMAANKGSLLTRIQRLIAPRPADNRPIAPAGAAALTLILASVLVWAAPQSSSQGQNTRSQAPDPPKTAREAPRPAVVAQAKPAAPRAVSAPKQGSYLDQMAQAGFQNLTADQMIAMKIHGVTADFIAEIKSLGWSPTPDQMVAFRIHGVDAATVKELRALGYTLTPDQAVALRVHRVSSAYANEWKQQGLKGLTLDNLVALKIHGADPAQLGDLKKLGFSDLSADDLVSLRVSGVTADFIREAQKYGFRDLRLQQIIQLKRLGILGSKESN
jgi:beta-lactamase regulating signal transducer with metallopeptidase domain